MNNRRIACWLRMIWAPLLIALEFTNIFTIMVEGPQIVNRTSRSPYLLQFATYGVCGLILLLDSSTATRLIQKRIFIWTFALLTLYAWGMLVRSFYVPAGIESYDFVRTFGLQVNAIGFMLACVVIFDHPKVLVVVKSAVALATLLGVAVNLYEVFHPGIFSSTPGRSAGFYVDSNCSGMALVLGCLVGLTAIRPRWRALYLLFTCAGVVATFSREAMLAFAILVAGAALGKALSLRGILLGGAIACVLFSALEVGNSLRESRSWNPANLARLRFETGDDSAGERLELGRQVLEQFETAPIFGHGFGTDQYWGFRTASHDFFLSMLADYGILGFFIIPALILSVRRRTWDSNVFGVVFLVWSLLLHLVLLLPFSLIVIAVQAVETAQSRASCPSKRAPVSPLRLRLSPAN